MLESISTTEPVQKEILKTWNLLLTHTVPISLAL
jgi:hypothetical protein